MNKTDFIKELEIQIKLSAEQCAAVNDVLENNFIFRKKNKLKIVAELAERLGVGETEADSIFERSISIIKSEVNHSLRHPLGSKQ